MGQYQPGDKFSEVEYENQFIFEWFKFYRLFCRIVIRELIDVSVIQYRATYRCYTPQGSPADYQSFFSWRADWRRSLISSSNPMMMRISIKRSIDRMLRKYTNIESKL